jgi:glycosyltransferase involved in cell wall biosynthesis
MKILHISGARSWGGNEQQMIDIIPELTTLGVENIVLGVGGSLLQKSCNIKGIEFLEVKKNKLNLIRNYFYLKNVVSSLKPDIIHLHTSDSLTVFTITDLFFRLRTKTVFSKKGMGSHTSFLSKLKYNYSGINALICVSKSVQVDFSKILKVCNIAKTVVVHDCVSSDVLLKKEPLNIRKKFNISSNQIIVGNIANHTKAKNLETFISVVDQFVNKMNRKDVVFIQIGEFSSLTDSFLESVKNKGLDENVFFTDKIENACSLNKQFDLFLLTSEREGGPTSVLEAMLCGIPVVSTQVGLISEIIENNINGFFVPVKNEVQLAEKVVVLLSDKKLQEQCSALNVKKIKEKFLAPFIANQTLNVYLQMLRL